MGRFREASTGPGNAQERPRAAIGRLRDLVPYLRPYALQIAGALVALTVGAGAVLVIGVGLRFLIDQGFRGGDTGLLDDALLVMIGVIAVLTLATFSRFYLVSWVGERVVADIRREVFRHILALSPAFYEVTRVGEVHSRLTTDTTLLQVVVGSSVSVALRNILMFAGGSVMLVVTSARLSGLVILLVPLVVIPDHRLRPPRAASVARQPGPRRRCRRLYRGNPQRDPHRSGVRP